MLPKMPEDIRSFAEAMLKEREKAGCHQIDNFSWGNYIDIQLSFIECVHKATAVAEREFIPPGSRDEKTGSAILINDRLNKFSSVVISRDKPLYLKIVSLSYIRGIVYNYISDSDINKNMKYKAQMYFSWIVLLATLISVAAAFTVHKLTGVSNGQLSGNRLWFHCLAMIGLANAFTSNLLVALVEPAIGRYTKAADVFFLSIQFGIIYIMATMIIQMILINKKSVKKSE